MFLSSRFASPIRRARQFCPFRRENARIYWRNMKSNVNSRTLPGHPCLDRGDWRANLHVSISVGMTCKDCPSFLKIQMKVLREGVGKGSLHATQFVMPGAFRLWNESTLCMTMRCRWGGEFVPKLAFARYVARKGRL
ncbi:hypothetical protein ALP44_101876 [Pseudomonas syringae pv. theae]|uniref:Uncharacterized protein n=6 Tax=Pseudomonas syringae group TaxID=136849 RepID=A0A3M2X1W3_PSEA0|nr:hypothetical protein ALQ94_101595 [Pseudomonas amygdali pv. morsprunorum]RMT58676.1 hypothetical protein ALP44_101876 [Pseudomonas syringae pv. theae]